MRLTGVKFIYALVAIILLVVIGSGITAREQAAFYQQCLSVPKTEAECQLLLSLKRDTDQARSMSAIAVGLAAGSR